MSFSLLQRKRGSSSFLLQESSIGKMIDLGCINITLTLTLNILDVLIGGSCVACIILKIYWDRELKEYGSQYGFGFETQFAIYKHIGRSGNDKSGKPYKKNYTEWKAYIENDIIGNPDGMNNEDINKVNFCHYLLRSRRNYELSEKVLSGVGLSTIATACLKFAGISMDSSEGWWLIAECIAMFAVIGLFCFSIGDRKYFIKDVLDIVDKDDEFVKDH